MLTSLKVVVSALIIAGVNRAANAHPQLAGWIAAAPIVSLLFVFWLVVDKRENDDISQFVIGVLLGLIPTAIYLAVFAAGLKKGFSFPTALLVGAAAWVGMTLVARRLGILGS